MSSKAKSTHNPLLKTHFRSTTNQMPAAILSQHVHHNVQHDYMRSNTAPPLQSHTTAPAFEAVMSCRLLR